MRVSIIPISLFSENLNPTPKFVLISSHSPIKSNGRQFKQFERYQLSGVEQIQQ